MNYYTNSHDIWETDQKMMQNVFLYMFTTVYEIKMPYENMSNRPRSSYCQVLTDINLLFCIKVVK